jgi:type IV pilus assembly protein PilQ
VAQQGEGKKLISLDFPETSLSTVLGVLSIKTGYKFITDSELAKKRIVLNLKDVTTEEALTALMDTYNLYYIRQQDTNIYVVKSKSEGTLATVSKVFFLNYPSAKDMADVLKLNLSKGGSISADERTNSLIVTDMAENVEKIGAMLKTLDIPTLQVMLEAKIVTVDLSSELQTGVDFTKLSRYGTLSQDVSYSQYFAPNAVASGRLSLSVLSNGYDIQGVIEALKTDKKAKILANPRLLVMNGKEATIDIVKELPYEERTITASGITITVNYKEVGIKMKVKPQINREGSIVLTVEPEQSIQSGSFDNIPIVDKSTSHTTFILENGETAVIGGLVRETDQVNEIKIPLLGDIPIIGYLFKNHDSTKERTELTFFITAKIVQ